MPDAKQIPLRSCRKTYDRAVVWYGTREQLLEAGVIQPNTVMPADPGTPRRSHLDYPEPGPGDIERAWSIPNDRFAVRVRFSAEEEAAADAEDARVDRQRAAAQVANELAALERAWPSSHEAFREQRAKCLKFGYKAIVVAVAATQEDSGGYRYTDDVRNEVEIHLQAIRGLMQTGRTVFDPNARAAILAAKRAQVARADDGFRGFLGRLQGQVARP